MFLIHAIPWQYPLYDVISAYFFTLSE